MTDSRKDRIERMMTRGQPRAARIGLPDLPRLVARAFEREDGPSAGAAPEDVQYVARSAETPSHQGSPDMRSDAIRRIVEATYAARMEAVSRNTSPKAKKEEPEGSSGASGDLAAIAEWYEELKAKGMGEAEIEEQIARRVRAIRQQMAYHDDMRRTGRS